MSNSGITFAPAPWNPSLKLATVPGVTLHDDSRRVLATALNGKTRWERVTVAPIPQEPGLYWVHLEKFGYERLIGSGMQFGMADDLAHTVAIYLWDSWDSENDGEGGQIYYRA